MTSPSSMRAMPTLLTLGLALATLGGARAARADGGADGAGGSDAGGEDGAPTVQPTATGDNFGCRASSRVPEGPAGLAIAAAALLASARRRRR
jgi:hypothetical protein